MTGDGLDREVIEQRAKVANFDGWVGRWESRYASDVPALLAALEAAEAEVERLRAVIASAVGAYDAVVKVDGPAVGKGVLRTEGGES